MAGSLGHFCPFPRRAAGPQSVLAQPARAASQWPPGPAPGGIPDLARLRGNFHPAAAAAAFHFCARAARPGGCQGPRPQRACLHASACSRREVGPAEETGTKAEQRPPHFSLAPPQPSLV